MTFNKQRKMILMKVSSLVKLENKEHNLATNYFSNFGSASDPQELKKKFRRLTLSVF